MKKITHAPDLEVDAEKPQFLKRKPDDTRSMLWQGFTAIDKTVSAALKDTHLTEGVKFFSTDVSDTELSFEINYEYRMDQKKNAKGLPTVQELKSNTSRLMAVHWLVTTPIKDATIVRVTRTETFQKLGEVSGMGRGTRTSAAFSHDEQTMSLPVAELIEQFQSAVGQVASERLKIKLAKAQALELG